MQSINLNLSGQASRIFPTSGMPLGWLSPSCRLMSFRLHAFRCLQPKLGLYSCKLAGVANLSCDSLRSLRCISASAFYSPVALGLFLLFLFLAYVEAFTIPRECSCWPDPKAPVGPVCVFAASCVSVPFLALCRRLVPRWCMLPKQSFLLFYRVVRRRARVPWSWTVNWFSLTYSQSLLIQLSSLPPAIVVDGLPGRPWSSVGGGFHADVVFLTSSAISLCLRLVLTLADGGLIVLHL